MAFRIGLVFSLFMSCAPGFAAYQPGALKFARITYTAGVPSIANQFRTAWLETSVTDAGLGNAGLTVKPGVYTLGPSCFCNSELDGTTCKAVASSNTAIQVKTYSIAIVLLSTLLPADSSFSIFCWGP